MAKVKLGIGIIGCGNIANKQHLPNYIRNPRARVVAANSRSVCSYYRNTVEQQ